MTNSPWPAPTTATRAREFISKRRQQVSGIALVAVIVGVVLFDAFVWHIPGF